MIEDGGIPTWVVKAVRDAMERSPAPTWRFSRILYDLDRRDQDSAAWLRANRQRFGEVLTEARAC